MARERIRHIPIMNGGDVVGMVTLQDFLKTLLR